MDDHPLTPDDSAFDAALDEAVRLTGIARYRDLCLGHPDAAVRAQYRGLVRAIAARGGQAPIPVDYGAGGGPSGGCSGCGGAGAGG